MSSITCHTLGGFKGGFFVQHGRQPTEQEIFNAGMRSGRDIIWPKHMVNNPDNQEMLIVDKKLFDEMLSTFCAFAHPDRVKAARQVIKEENTTISALNTPEHLKRVDSIKPVDTTNYARDTSTAIGGTLNRYGRNVFWQVSVTTVEDLPEKAKIGSKGFVTSNESVYDLTDKGWVLNESDTAFIKGKSSVLTLKEVLSHPSIKSIAVMKELEFGTQLPAVETEKTYTSFIAALLLEGITLAVSYTPGVDVHIAGIELISSHDSLNCITSINYADGNTDRPLKPVETLFMTDVSFLVKNETILVYRHKFIPCRDTVITL